MALRGRSFCAFIMAKQLAALPIGLADRIPKKSRRRKNTHGRANARALTAADRHLRAQECQDKKLRAATPESVPE